jgi:hypothetical protein
MCKLIQFLSHFKNVGIDQYCRGYGVILYHPVKNSMNFRHPSRGGNSDPTNLIIMKIKEFHKT